MISEASYHRIRMTSSLTLIDHVYLVNREFGVLIAQALDIMDELTVLI